MKAPINSTKHYVQVTLSSVSGVGVDNQVLVDGVNVTGANLAHEVIEGAEIKAVYVEFWLQNSASTLGSFTVALLKTVGSQGLPSSGEILDLFTYEGKKNVLYTSQGLSPGNTTALIPVIRQWVKIPKGKRRFGLGDRLCFSIRNNTTDDLNYCGFAVYKEYR